MSCPEAMAVWRPSNCPCCLRGEPSAAMKAAVSPPRPLNVTSVFPELAAHARTSIRLHPAPANPGPRDSSAGGPPTWPEHEEWPTCPGRRHLMRDQPHRPANVRGERSTAFAYHGEITWDEIPADTSWPLLPVLQVYAHDGSAHFGLLADVRVAQTGWREKAVGPPSRPPGTLKPSGSSSRPCVTCSTTTASSSAAPASSTARTPTARSADSR